jgi:hypothetical protein
MVNNVLDYVFVNDSQDLWIVDWKKRKGVHNTEITMDDLETNSHEYVEFNGWIGTFIEGQGFYEITEYDDEKGIIKFKKFRRVD